MTKMTGVDLPKISVVVINSRSETNGDWVDKCISSIKSQYYRNLEVIVIDNRADKYTIGKCRNDGIKQTDPNSKWVLFVDDDDWISNDYILSLLAFAEQNSTSCNVWVSSSCMFVYRSRAELRSESPIGMWRRDFLIKHRFNEGLKRLEDVDLFERMKKLNYTPLVATHIAGYFYRQHKDKNSGYKKSNIVSDEQEKVISEGVDVETVVKDAIEKQRIKEIDELTKEINGILNGREKEAV